MWYGESLSVACGEAQFASSSLFDHNIDLVAVLHVELLGRLSLVQAFSVEEEPHVARVELNEWEGTLWRWQ